MRLTRWDPFTSLGRLDREFDGLVLRAWGLPVRDGRSATGFVPAVETARDGTDMIIRFDLPGLDVERDVQVQVRGGRLIVSGERREETSKDRDGGLIRELRYGAFRREFGLPRGVGSDKVEASYDAGMLTVRVRDAVPAEAEPVRIPVQIGAGDTPSLAATDSPSQN